MAPETEKPDSSIVRLAPGASPWQARLVARYVPGYVEPGLLFEDWLLECLDKAKVWIDAGCGDNYEVLQRESFRGLAAGFDRPLLKKRKYLAADVYRMPFGDGTADLVTSRWVVEHLERPLEALGEMARVLRPGGVLLVRTTNRLHYAAFLSRLLPMGLKRRITGAREMHHTHYRFNDRRQHRLVSRRIPELVVRRARHIENLHYRSPALFVFSVLTESLLTRLGLPFLKSSVLMRFEKRVG